MRLLGVDFGSVRIGLAVAETEPRVISLRPAIPASGTLKKDAQTLTELAKKEETQAIILGIPLQEEANDGGKMQRICQRLKAEIEALGPTVHLQDETLTSIEAEAALQAAGLSQTQVKAKKDSEAAARILERFIAQAQP